MLKKLAKIGYKLVLFARYFPIRGVKNVRVANSSQILFYSGIFKVPIRKMRVGIPGIPEAAEHPNTCIPILESPHYKFARHLHLGGAEGSREDYEEFARWSSVRRLRNGDLGFNPSVFLRNFEKLFEILSDRGYIPDESPIIVYPRLWRNEYVILDGAHRASILAAMGYKEIGCGIALWEKRGPMMIYKL